MEAKEKAKELVEKFYQYSDGYRQYDIDEKYQWENAKKCALIAVDEMNECADDNHLIDFLKDVKKAIELL